MKRKLIWMENKDTEGFDCTAPDGTGVVVYPRLAGKIIEWVWIACYDPEVFESDLGTSATRGGAIKEALKALKTRGVDLKTLPRAS